MFPVNSIIDNALTDIRSKIEEQVYSTLAAHLKDYEGDAEDFTDRYGEIKELDIIKKEYSGLGSAGHPSYDKAIIHIKNIISTKIPKRPDLWIIHLGFESCKGQYIQFYMLDNYGNIYIFSDYTESRKFPSNSELILQPRLSNTLIDIIKSQFTSPYYGWADMKFSGDSTIQAKNIQILSDVCRKIAKYNQRLYGIINGLKKEVATLKSKIPETAPNPFD
jgi:hypothetical protein